jgi:predicted lipoprotein with Yx(FWY)xxD motif
MRAPAALVLPLALLAAACGSSNTNSSPSSPSSAATTSSTASSVQVGLSTRKLPSIGTILVNQGGRSLYVFTPEKGGKVACTGSCATTWPPLKSAGHAPSMSSTLVHAALVGKVADPSGGEIITYAGWPLHTYSGDSAAGQVTGQGIGGQWYAISPSGQVNMRKASSSSGGGYGGGY